MCTLYYEEGHWIKLRDTCQLLWEVWTTRHHEHTFDEHFIEELYLRYIYVLEHHSHAEYEFIRTITLRYRDTCGLVYGKFSWLTIKAWIELAHICMRSDKYINEAISLYEEVSNRLPFTKLSNPKLGHNQS